MLGSKKLRNMSTSGIWLVILLVFADVVSAEGVRKKILIIGGGITAKILAYRLAFSQSITSGQNSAPLMDIHVYSDMPLRSSFVPPTRIATQYESARILKDIGLWNILVNQDGFVATSTNGLKPEKDPLAARHTSNSSRLDTSRHLGWLDNRILDDVLSRRIEDADNIHWHHERVSPEHIELIMGTDSNAVGARVKGNNYSLLLDAGGEFGAMSHFKLGIEPKILLPSSNPSTWLSFEIPLVTFRFLNPNLSSAYPEIDRQADGDFLALFDSGSPIGQESSGLAIASLGAINEVVWQRKSREERQELPMSFWKTGLWNNEIFQSTGLNIVGDIHNLVERIVYFQPASEWLFLDNTPIRDNFSAKFCGTFGVSGAATFNNFLRRISRFGSVFDGHSARLFVDVGDGLLDSELDPWAIFRENLNIEDLVLRDITLENMAKNWIASLLRQGVDLAGILPTSNVKLRSGSDIEYSTQLKNSILHFTHGDIPYGSSKKLEVEWSSVESPR